MAKKSFEQILREQAANASDEILIDQTQFCLIIMYKLQKSMDIMEKELDKRLKRKKKLEEANRKAKKSSKKKSE